MRLQFCCKTQTRRYDWPVRSAYFAAAALLQQREILHSEDPAGSHSDSAALPCRPAVKRSVEKLGQLQIRGEAVHSLCSSAAQPPHTNAEVYVKSTSQNKIEP